MVTEMALNTFLPLRYAPKSLSKRETLTTTLASGGGDSPSAMPSYSDAQRWIDLVVELQAT